MTPVRSIQLYGGQGTVGSSALVYTVPTGKRTILKSVVATNRNASACLVEVNAFDGSTQIMALDAYLAAAGTEADMLVLEPWAVLEEGQTVQLYVQRSTTYVVISGAELTL